MTAKQRRRAAKKVRQGKISIIEQVPVIERKSVFRRVLKGVRA